MNVLFMSLKKCAIIEELKKKEKGKSQNLMLLYINIYLHFFYPYRQTDGLISQLVDDISKTKSP